jgi:hypothetical protein
MLRLQLLQTFNRNSSVRQQTRKNPHTPSNVLHAAGATRCLVYGRVRLFPYGTGLERDKHSAMALFFVAHSLTLELNIPSPRQQTASCATEPKSTSRQKQVGVSVCWISGMQLNPQVRARSCSVLGDALLEQAAVHNPAGDCMALHKSWKQRADCVCIHLPAECPRGTEGLFHADVI